MFPASDPILTFGATGKPVDALIALLEQADYPVGSPTPITVDLQLLDVVRQAQVALGIVELDSIEPAPGVVIDGTFIAQATWDGLRAAAGKIGGTGGQLADLEILVHLSGNVGEATGQIPVGTATVQEVADAAFKAAVDAATSTLPTPPATAGAGAAAAHSPATTAEVPGTGAAAAAAEQSAGAAAAAAAAGADWSGRPVK